MQETAESEGSVVGQFANVGQDCILQADFQSASVSVRDSPEGRLEIGRQDAILPHICKLTHYPVLNTWAVNYEGVYSGSARR